MVYIPNRAAGVLDMHPSAVLRKASDGAETASVAEAPIALDVIDATSYADRQLGSIAVAVMINVTAMDTADGDETYTIAVEVASDSVFTTPTKVAEILGNDFFLIFNNSFMVPKTPPEKMIPLVVKTCFLANILVLDLVNTLYPFVPSFLSIGITLYTSCSAKMVAPFFCAKYK